MAWTVLEAGELTKAVAVSATFCAAADATWVNVLVKDDLGAGVGVGTSAGVGVGANGMTNEPLEPPDEACGCVTTGGVTGGTGVTTASGAGDVYVPVTMTEPEEPEEFE